MANEAEATAGLAPVTPRSADRPDRGRWKRGAAALAIAVVVTAVLLLTANLLGDAALFFYNTDEAVARRDELGSRRFKIQGTPLAEPETAFRDDLPVLFFSIGFNGVVVDVTHTGDPPELFQPGVPVVLEGAWERKPVMAASTDFDSDSLTAESEESPRTAESGESPGDAYRHLWHFASDRMMVKHDNDYRDRGDYQERVTEAGRGGESS